MIPADCCLVQATSFVYKAPSYLAGQTIEAVMPERNLTLLYRGSEVVSGYGYCVVCAVGLNTFAALDLPQKHKLAVKRST